MKTLIRICSLLAIGFNLGAQGIVQFSAQINPLNPPTPNNAMGQGTFSLSNHVFWYAVEVMPAGRWDSQIRGPDAGGTEVVLFDLGSPGCIPPLGEDLGVCYFLGRFDLSDTQISDLLANRWYVTTHQAGLEVHLRGQIVPEPSICLLLLLGGAALGLKSFVQTHKPSLKNSTRNM
jgi:hypothetical protein